MLPNASFLLRFCYIFYYTWVWGEIQGFLYKFHLEDAVEGEGETGCGTVAAQLTSKAKRLCGARGRNGCGLGGMFFKGCIEVNIKRKNGMTNLATPFFVFLLFYCIMFLTTVKWMGLWGRSRRLCILQVPDGPMGLSLIRWHCRYHRRF